MRGWIQIIINIIVVVVVVVVIVIVINNDCATSEQLKEAKSEIANIETAVDDYPSQIWDEVQKIEGKLDNYLPMMWEEIQRLEAKLDKLLEEESPPIPLPWPTWEIVDGAVRGKISLAESSPESVVLELDWIILPGILEFDDLLWEDLDEGETSVLWPSDVWLAGWTALPSVTLEPGGEYSVDIPLPVVEVETNTTVVLEYTVALASAPDDIMAGFVNAAPMQLKVGGPQMVGPLSIFRLHNDWKDGVNNFELKFSGLKTDDFIKFYGSGFPTTRNELWGKTWYSGWGINPDTGNASVVEKPDGTIEIVWKDTKNTIKVCEWVYFGVEIKPNKTFPPPAPTWTKST